jgi:hypothetical protein
MQDVELIELQESIKTRYKYEKKERWDSFEYNDHNFDVRVSPRNPLMTIVSVYKDVPKWYNVLADYHIGDVEISRVKDISSDMKKVKEAKDELIKVTENPKKFRMSVPPQQSDTDTIIYSALDIAEEAVKDREKLLALKAATLSILRKMSWDDSMTKEDVGNALEKIFKEYREF